MLIKQARNGISSCSTALQATRTMSSAPAAKTRHNPNTPSSSSSDTRTQTVTQSERVARPFSLIPRHQTVLRDVPLLPLDGIVQFPHGRIKLLVCDPSLNVMMSEAFAAHRIVGVISQLSPTAESDRGVVRRQVQLATNASQVSFASHNLFERVRTASSVDDLRADNESHLTGWRCADVGTLVELGTVGFARNTNAPNQPDPRFESPFASSIAPKPSHPQIVASHTLTISAHTLKRFLVRSYKRSLLGFWTADVEVMREEWGFGGRRHATHMMGDIQQLLTNTVLHLCPPRLAADLITATDPVKFSYLVPKMFPSFGLSSLLSQAVLQCHTCTARLALERHIITTLAEHFPGPRPFAVPVNTNITTPPPSASAASPTKSSTVSRRVRDEEEN